ncbi:MAG TPA: FHA domain-containing protein [Myxococcales bacterium]|jgi:hypothetical protein
MNGDGRAFALRFISGKYQGGEYPLADAGEVVIGRSSGVDMVLIEELVSRKHAKLALGGDAVTISDLGSTNGTFVNGERIKEATLEEGDRVLIGTSILKLVRIARGAPVDAKTAQKALDQRALAEEKKTGGRPAVQGRLEEVPLVDLLQLLSTSKKTGAIVIHGQRAGQVLLRSGKVVTASIDGQPAMSPKKALYRMTAWPGGSFEFVPREGELPAQPGELTESTELLVMEAMQQADELGREDLPSAASAIGLAMPLAGKLRDLPAQDLDLVQLAHDEGTVQAVLDRVPGSDLEVAKRLAQLIERGYLRQF